ncbi:bifunctional aminoglycoside phosphotransferase/ATP-binding protein [Actinomadura sp. 7K507]|uniref:bifunctional aminoglycoside phosphotransferase/ATP-binding protein n=1 Tax=Actinomadura sp. 7K507 TaxID=2530365 RepID=UPI001052F2F3|nr:bifunctional aminoglycoside phosphotransferase/ATP-binding protein [Actinomadura sp. 7K507]TDC86785.1 gluconate kinase [Actinomadura sp. 7K507]
MDNAAVSETHIGVVFFVGDRAYKLKKPVNLGFLDFSTRELRERACHEEVRLNSRFSPDVYLGIADVHGPGGEVCDHLLVMRRMPADRRLATLIQAGAPVEDALRDIARIIAAWHAQAPRGPRIAAQGTRDALLARWADSFDQVRPFHGEVIDVATATQIEDLVTEFLAGRRALFHARIDDGRVVDGHGDLLAGDIFCLDDGPRILDCLEFDDKLRSLDGIDDASFLAMDLERLGAPGLAERFITWYAEFAADPAPPSLRHHYVAYRAFVRAKVACMRHAQGDPDAAADARAYSAIALRHLRAGRVGLILVGGLPGTGKTSLAGALADRLGCSLLSSDRIRKELAGLAPHDSAAAPYGTGIYTPEWNRRTYCELADRAAKLLRRGETVVLDASWTSRQQRDLLAATAEREHAHLSSLRCQAPEALTAERIRTRARGPSDADTQTATAMRTHADPWPEAITIDTSGPLADAAEQALTAVHPPGPGHIWPRRPFFSPD